MAISQRISLEGSEDIRKKLEELGRVGEEAFRKLREAARKGIVDPQQIDRAKQSIDKLGESTEKAGAEFKSASSDATGFSIRVGVVAGAVAALTSKLISLAGQLKQALSPSEALKGTVETGKAISDQADKLKLTVPEWLKLSKAIAAAGVSQETFTAGASDLAKKVADAKGGFVELVPGQLVSTSKGAVPVMRDLAEQITRIGNETQKAKAGTAAFGENWKEVIKALTGGKAAADAAEDIFDTLAKVDRALSPDQAEKAARLAKGWDVLGKAIRAAKDQIGTVLLDSALLRAEWLIKLIDGARELFKTWQQLAEAKKAAFIEGLGDSPAEFIFKTLIALGQQLAGIWNQVLVPAGEKLMGIIGDVAGGFEGVSKSQVAAFFITAAAAAVGLAIALKGISLLLAPLALLGTLFSPFGAALIAVAAAAALFWDEIKEGAASVAALIPEQMEQIKSAIGKLFSGDFAGFWAEFSEAAVSAFGVIKQALSQLISETPWAQTFLDGIKQIAIDAPGAIKLVADAFIALGQAATTVANVINFIFGTNLTGTGVALLAIITSMTGGFVALAAIATILGVGIGAVASAVSIFGGTAVAITAGIVALGVAIQALVTNWDSLTAAVSAAGGAIWDTFRSAGEAAINAIMGLIDRLIAKIVGVGSAIAGIFRGGGTPGDVGPVPGNASGGLIGGRGTGTSDSNLSWVSRGEHIMPARAVRQPGMLAFLEALRRSGGNLGRVLDGMGRYAAGGLVMPQLGAGGGGSMSHVTIQFPGMASIGGLRAPSDVVDELRKAAAMAQVRSGGRKPSRYT